MATVNHRKLCVRKARSKQSKAVVAVAQSTTSHKATALTKNAPVFLGCKTLCHLHLNKSAAIALHSGEDALGATDATGEPIRRGAILGVKPRIEIMSHAGWVARVEMGQPHQCRADHPSLQLKWRTGYARIQTDSVSFLGLTSSRTLVLDGAPSSGSASKCANSSFPHGGGIRPSR